MDKVKVKLVGGFFHCFGLNLPKHQDYKESQSPKLYSSVIDMFYLPSPLYTHREEAALYACTLCSPYNIN